MLYVSFKEMQLQSVASVNLSALLVIIFFAVVQQLSSYCCSFDAQSPVV